MLSAALPLAGCSLKLPAPAPTAQIILADDDAVLLNLDPITARCAAESPPGSGQWEEIGVVKIPPGRVIFRADTGPVKP